MYKDLEKYKAYQKKKQAEYRKDPEARTRRAAVVARHLAKPETKAKRSKYQKERYASDPKGVMARHRRNQLAKFGWTPESIEVAKISQGNACAICREEFVKTPHADHEHVEPPKSRALLCRLCNVGLGVFRDNPELLDKASEYLRKWK